MMTMDKACSHEVVSIVFVQRKLAMGTLQEDGTYKLEFRDVPPHPFDDTYPIDVYCEDCLRHVGYNMLARRGGGRFAQPWFIVKQGLMGIGGEQLSRTVNNLLPLMGIGELVALKEAVSSQVDAELYRRAVKDE